MNRKFLHFTLKLLVIFILNGFLVEICVNEIKFGVKSLSIDHTGTTEW